MINIKGFTIKNIKSTEGREGAGILFDIYFGKTCVAYYADYGDGAMPQLDFVPDQKEYQAKLAEAMNAFYAKYPDLKQADYISDSPSDVFSNIDKFAYRMYLFNEDQKAYNKYAKQGRRTTVVYTADFADRYLSGNCTLAQIEKYFTDNAAKIGKYSERRIYTSPSDFVIA